MANALREAALLAITLAGYYFSPVTLLSAAFAVLFGAVAWRRLDIALLAVPLTAPFYRFPKVIEAGELFGRSAAPELSLSEFAFALCLAVWVAQRAGHRSLWRVLKRRELLPAWAFIALSLLSVVFAENKHVAERQFRVVILEPALFYVMVVSVFRSLEEVARSLWALVALGAGVAAYTFYHYIFVGVVEATGGVRRALAIYHSPNALALFFGRLIPVAAAFAIPLRHRRSSPRWAWLAAGAAALMLAALAITYSRGALVGVAAAFAFLLLFTSRRAPIVAGVVVAVVALLALPFLPLDRLGQGGPVAERLYVWQAALAMALDHPITGIGLDNFLYYYPRYMLPQAALEPDIAHPHNLFLDFWTSLGILGLAFLIWVQLDFWRRGVRLLKTAGRGWDRLATLAILASMVNFLVHGLLDNSYFLIDLAYLFWLSYALLRVLELARLDTRPA